jgi:hypothetical protein
LVQHRREVNGEPLAPHGFGGSSSAVGGGKPMARRIDQVTFSLAAWDDVDPAEGRPARRSFVAGFMALKRVSADHRGNDGREHTAARVGKQGAGHAAL